MTHLIVFFIGIGSFLLGILSGNGLLCFERNCPCREKENKKQGSGSSKTSTSSSSKASTNRRGGGGGGSQRASQTSDPKPKKPLRFPISDEELEVHRRAQGYIKDDTYEGEARKVLWEDLEVGAKYYTRLADIESDNRRPFTKRSESEPARDKGKTVWQVIKKG